MNISNALTGLHDLLNNKKNNTLGNLSNINQPYKSVKADKVELSNLSVVLQNKMRSINEISKSEKIKTGDTPSLQAQNTINEYISQGKEVERVTGAEDLDDFQWGLMVSIAETIGVSKDKIMGVSFEDLEDYHHEFVIKDQAYIKSATEGINIKSFDSEKNFWDAKFESISGGNSFEMIKLQEKGSIKFNYIGNGIFDLPSNDPENISYSSSKGTSLKDVDAVTLMMFNEGLKNNDDSKMAFALERFSLLDSSNKMAKYHNFEDPFTARKNIVNSKYEKTKDTTNYYATLLDSLNKDYKDNQEMYISNPYGNSTLFVGESSKGYDLYKTNVAGMKNTLFGNADKIN